MLVIVWSSDDGSRVTHVNIEDSSLSPISTEMGDHLQVYHLGM